MLSLTFTAALACGQTTHVWTTLHALEHLPEGPLKAQLSSDEVRGALVSGAMFPDGGYVPGDPHPYGEASHWEPFQDRYLDWMAQRPQLPERDRHVAFLMGMAAHGMGDQTYDAAYLLRAGEHDGVGQSSDTATDIHYAALEGAREPNPHWVPYSDLVPLFADAGIEVDEGRLESGMAALDVAVAVVGFASTNAQALEQNAATAPWATSHLDDPNVPGAPACLGKTIAAYWLSLDSRLHGGEPEWVLDSFPEPGGYAWPTTGVDATASVVFGRALVRGTIEGRVTLTGPGGDVPIRAWMYYGEASNVLDVEPLEPLAEDSDFELSIEAGVETIGGDVLSEPLITRFSTGPAPALPLPTEDSGAACGCAQPGGHRWWFASLAPLVFGRRRPQR